MRYQFVIPPLLFVPFLMTNGNHTTKIEKDVIVTYSNHAEAESKPISEAKTEIQIIVPEKFIDKKKSSFEERDSNEVVFVPNEKEVPRNEDYLRKTPIKIEDYMVRRTVDDVMDNGQVRVETEPPADVLFLTGKNNENENIKEPKREREHSDTRRSETDIGSIVPKLNCSNLDCNNTIDSICGGKIEHKQWKYRLFLNECFFRKVNCYFKHSVNRYHRVFLEKCENVGAHVITRPSLPQIFPPEPAHRHASAPVKINNTRRNFPSRRSLTRSIDGKACSHACPATCPDDYQPECAVSGTGQRKVFVNHCKLDYNSCTFGVAWYKRPLAECVGGKKADMRQNRGFIDWMQRVGIVDNKGRLVLS